MADHVPHFPGRAAIDAYGDGGFRFADMSHKGSILLLPSGVYGWPVSDIAQVTPGDFAPVLAEADDVAFLILGCGMEFALPSGAVRDAFAAANVGLEPMDTGAAARTYNVLLAEGRAVAAALIAVDEPK
ncbi:MAG: Mth938-like domain-containing protein [Hyphomicrobiales bacterium]